MFQLILITLLNFSPSDSLRMETINGKQYVVHQVGEKETLYSISRRYGATIAAILEQNPTADAGLEVGQIIKVPYTAKAKTQPAIKTADGTIHKVAPKETLFSIARLYNVSVDDIKSWNNLKDNALSVGQDIVIRKNQVVAPATTAVSSTAAKTHTVAPKETMFSIAKQYGMTVTQLKEWNNLQGTELKVGQVITVAAPAVLPGNTTATANTTTNTAAVANTATVAATTSVVVSESVNGTDEVRESGMAELIEGTEGNRKYLAQHTTVKPGTILKIRNLTTNQEVFVRVTGPAPNPDPATLIRISRSAYDRLGATEPKFRAEITYYK